MVLDEIYNQVHLAQSKSEAYDIIALRSNDAQEYCQKHLPEAWGKNIWHAILDDAIRMRKENDSK